GKVLKDDKGKMFVLEYSGRKRMRIREGKGKKRLLREVKVIGEGSLSGEGRVVRRREGYWEVYYQRGCNCQE
ncbi:3784_t:CDS:2, partial [Gigaspora margarita]